MDRSSGYGIVPPEPHNISKSAARALEVMELFGLMQRPLRASEISEALEIGPSSTSQLLKTLAHGGFLHFNDQTKLYLPTIRLGGFADWLGSADFALDRLRKLLSLVHTETGLTATVSTRLRTGMQIIETCGPDPIAKGSKFPLAGSVPGLAFLATLDDPEIERILDRGRLCDRPGYPSRRKWQEDIGRVREKGYAAGQSMVSGCWAIGLPLPADFRRVPMVLGFSGDPEDIAGHEAEWAARIRSIMESELS